MKKGSLLFLLTFVNYYLVWGQNPIKNLKSPASITACPVSVATPATNTLCASNPVVLTASGSTFYQWQKNDVDIQGANGSDYPANTPGMYKTYAVESVWTAQNSGVTIKLNSVFFIDKLKGWAAGDGGVILATTNGGTTWTPQNSTITTDLNGIAFTNATTGIAVGDGGKIVRTTNGGSTWASVTSATTSNLYRVSFGDANTAMAAGGGNGPRIVKTTDAGLTWAFVYNESTGMGTGASTVDMVDANTAFAIWGGGPFFYPSLLKSTDGGANWASSGGFFSTSDIEMQNVSVGFIVGGGLVEKTINGGNSWLNLGNNIPPTNSSYVYQFEGVTFPSSNIGWIVGAKAVSSNTIGSIFSTADGGNTWTTESPDNTKSFMDLYFVDNENGWAVGENGQIYKHSFNKLCVSNTVEIIQGTGNNSMTISGATSICMGASVTLTASGCAGTVNWSTGASGVTSITVSPTITTTYAATCSTPNVCPASITITVTNPPIPVITGLFKSVNSTSLSICPGDSILLSCTNCSYIQGATLNWSSGATSDSTNYTSPYFKPSTTGNYYATRTLNGCASGQSNQVAVTVKSFFNVTGSTSILKGNSATLTASGCPVTVTWNNGGGAGSSIVVSPTVTTTYTASCNDPNICVVNNSATVTVYSAMIANPPTTKLCVSNPIVLTATGSQFYQWQKDNVDIQGANESSYSVTQPGIYKTYAVQSLWTAQNSGITTKLKSVFFVDKLKGWAAGDGGVILATTNGGTTWSPQNSTITTNLNGIAFIDATIGIAVGDGGKIVRTTNGGSTWASVPSATTSTLYRVSFGDANTAMAAGGGNGPRIVKTTNAGLTWAFAYNTNGLGGTGVYPIDMLDANNAIAVYLGGAAFNSILKTSDSGTNWTKISLHANNGPDPFGDSHISDIEMQNASLGFMVGSSGGLGKTTNGGTSWANLSGNLPPNSTIHDLEGITFPSSNLGWIVGGQHYYPNNPGVIFSTVDGGNTWLTETPDNAKSLIDVFFVDNENGWTVGTNGQIYKHSFNKFGVSNSIEIADGPGNNPMTVNGSANICIGASATLTATGCTGTVTWNNGAGTGTSITVSPTVTTTYVASCSTPDMCPAAGTITVINPPVPTITGLLTHSSGTSLSICPGDSIRLSCTNCSVIQGATLNWPTGATSDSANYTSPYFKPLATGTYYATRSLGGCASAQSNLVSVTVKSDYNVTGSTDICKGGSATLTATGCPGTVTWQNGVGTGSSIVVSPTVTTTYTAYCDNPNICPKNYTATVTVYSALIGTPTATNICTTNPIVLTTTGSTFYQWQKNDVDIQGANGSNYPANTPGMYKTYAVQSLWTAQNSGITTKLKSVFFVDKLKGWAAGDGGVILATTNGGTTWTPQNSTITTDLNGIAFTNATTGIAVGDGGKIVRTTNGGSTWASVTSATTSNLYRVSFGDANTAMAAGGGNGPRIVKTTNAGLTWAFAYNTNGLGGTGVYPIDMVDANNAIAVYLGGAAFNSILKTSDSGTNWTEISLYSNSAFRDSHISDIEMQNASLGFMVGSSGGLGKTTNGGTSWANLSGNLPPNSTIHDLEGITFPSSNLGWIIGGQHYYPNNPGVIFSTVDGGNTWLTETPDNAKSLVDLFFIDNENGWTVGDNGQIYKHSFNKFCLSNTIVITANPTNNTPLILTGTATSGSQATANTITSTQTINSGVNVRYTSGKSISLEPNFKADTGSVFKAQIGGACN